MAKSIPKKPEKPAPKPVQSDDESDTVTKRTSNRKQSRDDNTSISIVSQRFRSCISNYALHLDVSPAQGRVPSRARLKDDKLKVNGKGKATRDGASDGEESDKDPPLPSKKPSSRRSAKSHATETIPTSEERVARKPALSDIQEEEEPDVSSKKLSSNRSEKPAGVDDKTVLPPPPGKKTTKRIGLVILEDEPLPESSAERRGATLQPAEIPAEPVPEAATESKSKTTGSSLANPDAEGQTTKPLIGREKRGQKTAADDDDTRGESTDLPPPKKSKKVVPSDPTDVLPQAEDNASVATTDKPRSTSRRKAQHKPPSSKIQKENSQSASKGRKPKVRLCFNCNAFVPFIPHSCNVASTVHVPGRHRC